MKSPHRIAEYGLVIFTFFGAIGGAVGGSSTAEAAVLILGDNGLVSTALTDTQSKLAATNRLIGSVDVFDTSLDTPPLSFLQDYNAVLLAHMWSTADKMTLGDTLADYVDGGGGVVATFALSHHGPDGRWQDDEYDPIVRNGISVVDTFVGTVYDPTHPIMDGVTAVSSGLSWPNFYPHPSAIVIADWNDRYGPASVMAAELDLFAGRVVSLNLVSYSVDANLYTGWSGDGDILMANALNYVVPEPGTLLLSAIGLVLFVTKAKGGEM